MFHVSIHLSGRLAMWRLTLQQHSLCTVRTWNPLYYQFGRLSVISDEGFKLEILSRIAQATAALTKLKPVWIDESISLSSKIRLIRSLVTSTFLMLVNHGLSQQSSKEEYKPRKWGATGRYYASHKKTVLPTTKSVPRSNKQSDHTKTSWLS